ncbi:hypothetical protein BDN70DRAFT_828321 [Pholiota conissans]|uniref:non-specific serine/threonine protein kinase n=1 Tax=Pholiota conissans TaxID=109636 RepID=A0A9P6D4T8_9AGAR|nr:hypothetical protein BDN70DRAFT_828321 [Pholiota conissans]
MESTEDAQKEEITALHSIYGDDFIDVPPPKAWKGAQRLYEFIVRISHPEPEYSSRVSINLHVKFPKTYPHLACPTFGIDKPYTGVNDGQATTLLRAINAEAQHHKGNVMVFEIVSFAQEWLRENVNPPPEVVGSLALQMNQRAIEEARERQRIEEEEAQKQREIAMMEAAALEYEISAAREKAQRSRRRANSEATEVPDVATYDDDEENMIETFNEMTLDGGGVRFTSVRVYQPRPAYLGTIFVAIPIIDPSIPVPPMELYSISFASQFYTTTQGRKRLTQVEQEIKSLINIRHSKLQTVYGVKLILPRGGDPPRLMVLNEQAPSLTLHDVLEECENFREERATEYCAQILSALSGLHHGGLVHKAISTRCIGLVSAPGQSKSIKLCRANYHTRLLDLHRSNPFGPEAQAPLSSSASTYHLSIHTNGHSAPGSSSGSGGERDEMILPEGWVSRDVQNESTLLYTKLRDIHDVGVVLMQMLMGLSVVERYPDPASAIRSSHILSTLANTAMIMLEPPKKPAVTCESLLAEFTLLNSPTASPNTSRAMTFGGRSSNAYGNGGGGLEPKTPMRHFMGSPETPNYTRMALGMGMTPSSQKRHTSRWKEDWEELELLGKGAFGSVVKAKNKIDSQIYAVKKIRLKTMQTDKIFREVTALSSLSHRNIVRYYTTWVETYESSMSATASISGSDSSVSSEEVMTSVPTLSHRNKHKRIRAQDSDSDDEEEDINGGETESETDGDETCGSENSNERHLPVNGNFHLNFGDFDDVSSRSSFPSIHFSRTSSPEIGDESEGASSSEEEDGDDFSGLFNRSRSRSASEPLNMALSELNAADREGPHGLPMSDLSMPYAPPISRTLYIQMEFVERQTLRERVDEGLNEDEAWRLFHQIVDALKHMAAHNILHRDIKLTNIFIDAKGDCKVGDFGLATSSLAAVDPSDVASPAVIMEADMTLEVGTRLYIAPEVQSRRRGRGPRDHSKADMYSLGIVFFEMNFKFNTGAERIAVLEDLRKPTILFPAGWESHRTRQKDIITWLLQHQPEKRPSATELSESALLPRRMEYEFYKDALRDISQPDSPYYQSAIAALFAQTPRPRRYFVYDSMLESPEYASLNNIVEERLAAIFHLHGAVDVEPPLLMPVSDVEEDKNQARFIDMHGDVVALPNNILTPFARLAARESIKRIKRYHIANVYRLHSASSGHPQYTKAALFDIISPDLENGPLAAGAEIIAVVNDCLDSFPNLSQSYDIHISHSKIVEIVMQRIPADARQAVVDLVHSSKSSAVQKRAVLVKKGLSRNTIDELELLSEPKEIDVIAALLEKTAATLGTAMKAAIKEVKETILYATSAGISRKIFFRPLMLGSHNTHLKDGVIVEVVKRNKHTDILAAGGRYDNLIHRFLPTKQPPEPICALGIQIAVEKITTALASYQSASIKTLVKEDRSFGFWSPRRCDVYVISYHPGHMRDRLEVVSYLWQNNISADLMYESGLPDTEHENHLDICAREGILFTVYPRPRASRTAGFKVKSILKGNEVDLTKQELVSWLQHQIAEQKRIDATTSGAPGLADSLHVPIKETPANPLVQLVLPDPKKQRKGTHLYEDKAFNKVTSLQNSFQAGMPMLGVDVAPAHFDAMVKSSAWITDDEAWKPIAAMFPTQYAAYAQLVRETALKRKSEGNFPYILIYSVREDRAQLLDLR